MRLFGKVDSITRGVLDRAWFLTPPFDISVSGQDGAVGLSATVRGGLSASVPADAPLAATVRGGLSVEFEP